MSGLIKSQCRFTHCLLCFFQISKGPTVRTGCSKQFFLLAHVSVQDCSPTKVVTALCHQSTKLPTAVHSFFSSPFVTEPPGLHAATSCSTFLWTVGQQRVSLHTETETESHTDKRKKGMWWGEKRTHTKTSLYPLNSQSQTNQYHFSSMSIFSSSLKQQAQSQRHSLPCNNDTPWSVSAIYRMSHTSLLLLNTNKITPLMTRPWGRWLYAETSKCFVSVAPPSFGEYVLFGLLSLFSGHCPGPLPTH